MVTISSFNIFDRILCISLERCLERRAHIRNEFALAGITEYQFINAFDKSSEEVIKLYESDFVKKFPPCFRCGQDECDCENKSLFHPQIGNWLSHMAAWRQVSEKRGRLTLICEDDIKFQASIHECLVMVNESEVISAHLASGEPVLIRIGWALSDDHSDTAAPHLTLDIKMANPCYAINQAMAKHLLDSLDKIDTTSDIYVHRIVGARVNHFTVMPPPVYELSWSTGELLSEIRPKQKHVESLRKRLKELEPSEEEYREILRKIAMEEKRILEFEEFNANPSKDYRNQYPLI